MTDGIGRIGISLVATNAPSASSGPAAARLRPTIRSDSPKA
jgi:hypothetical protein